MPRYRLRFQLQEIDLVPGETLLGRSPDCHVTIEDPLVSRVHARIVVDDDSATIEDLGSRNGVRVNGVLVKAPVRLHDRDRLRIGTQEFLLHLLLPEGRRPAGKSTGFLCRCAHCDTAFAEEMLTCPQCGASVQPPQDENTLSGELLASRPIWNMELLFELIERALMLGRWEDAEEVLARVDNVLQERLIAGDAPSTEEYGRLLEVASRVAQARHSVHLVHWIARVVSRSGHLPSAEVVARLRTIPLQESGEVVAALDECLQRSRSSAIQPGSPAASSLAAIEQWRREIHQ